MVQTSHYQTRKLSIVWLHRSKCLVVSSFIYKKKKKVFYKIYVLTIMMYIFFSNIANTASKKKYYFDILVHFRSCWESKFSLFSFFRNAFLKATLWLRSFLMTFRQTEDVSTEGPNTSLRSYDFSCYLKMWVKILFNCYRYVLGLPLVILWGIDRTRHKNIYTVSVPATEYM